MKRILQTLHLLHKGEDAQGMVFGAISLFMLAACVGLAHNSGVITSRRVQVQTAADSAAYAGALTTANILSDVAWMNDGMAYIYYNLMRSAVDVTVYRTLAEMKLHNYYPYNPKDDPPSSRYVEPDAKTRAFYTSGGGDPEALWETAYKNAAATIPRGEKWMKMISDMEWALAKSGRYLVRDAIFKAAEGSYATFDAKSKGHDNDVVAVGIVQNLHDVYFINPNGENVDMILEYNPDGQPLWKITYNGKLYAEIWKLGPDHWQIRRLNQKIDIIRLANDEWKIKTGNLEADIKKYKDGTIEVTVTGSDYAHLLCIPMGNGMWAVSGQAGGADVQYEPFAGGGYKLTVNGQSVGVRMQGGKMQQFKDGSWQTLPNQDTVNVGGKDVKISVSNHIDLPGKASLDYPGRINLGPMSFNIPDQVHFGGMDITLARDSVKITGSVGNVGIVIDGGNDGCAVLNGLNTCDASSAVKHDYGEGHHRIETVIPGRRWKYKWRAIEGIVAADSTRLGIHAIADVERNSPEKNDWAYSRELGKRNGWFDISTGSPAPLRYHLTTPCWNPADADKDGTIAGGGHCPTCYWGEDQMAETTPDGHPLVDKDGDDISDVRKYGDSMTFNVRKVENEQVKYPQLKDRDDKTLQVIDLATNAQPLCVTQSVFAHPLIVAVWIRPDIPFLGSRPNQSGSGVVPFFRNPDSGYFAVAAARVGVFSTRAASSSSIGGISDPSYIFTFDKAIDAYNFDAADSYDVRAKDRERWLTSWHNNFEPVWTARLWALSEIVQSTDQQIAYAQEELEQTAQVGMNFIWRVLQEETVWWDPRTEDVVELCQPDAVGEAGNTFSRSIHGPAGPFSIGANTPPEQLEKALQH